MRQIISNTEILLFVMGYQGGTLKQCADELGVTESVILDADYYTMQKLMRRAQQHRNLRGA